MNKKTILLAIHDGVMARNVLNTDCLNELLKYDQRVVVAAPEEKADYYRKRYLRPGLEVVQYHLPTYKKWELYLHTLRHYSIPSQSIFFKTFQTWFANRRFPLFVVQLLCWILGHLPFWRDFLDWITRTRAYPAFCPELLDAIKPDILFVSDLSFLPNCDLIRAAKEREIATVGMIKSWDNLSSKVAMPHKPDRLVVYNYRTEYEAWKWCRYPRERCRVIGLPQYDRYFNPQPYIKPREEFMKEAGLDPEKPFILYCSAGKIFAPFDAEILKMVDDEIETGTLQGMQCLVRLHPKYDCGESQLTDCKHLHMGRFATFTSEKAGSWEYEDKDLSFLINSLYWSTAVVQTASTMGIEGVIFDKPTIGIRFDGTHTPSFLRSARRFYAQDHIKPLVACGGIELASSREELMKLLLRAWQEPAFNKDKRLLTVIDQGVFRDGYSAFRLAHAIMWN